MGMYDIQNYYQAGDVEDAVRTLHKNPEAVLISGGSDVLIKIREGKLAGCSLVSINGIPELQSISREDDGTIVIGAGATFAGIAGNEIIRRYIPMLGHAVDQAGGPQLRNVGTIGGNICNGATSADSAPGLFALNAVLVLKGADGIRELPIRQFYTGPGRTVRAHDEILTEIRITRENYHEYGGHYIKYGKRNAMEIATLSCACMVRLTKQKDGVEDMRLAYGVAAPTPIRCSTVEQQAKGMKIGHGLYEMVGQGVLKEINPRSSWRASREFRLLLAEELAKRVLKQAIRYAGGEANA